MKYWTFVFQGHDPVSWISFTEARLPKVNLAHVIVKDPTSFSALGRGRSPGALRLGRSYLGTKITSVNYATEQVDGAIIFKWKR